MDAWRERDETRRRSLFLLEAQTKKVGGWVQAVAPRDGRLVSCRVVGISLLWPGVECQSAAANGKLEGVFLVAPVRWREREKKIGRLLKLEVVVFTTASTAAQQEQEQKEKRSHTMGSFSLFPFPQRPHQQFLARLPPVQQQADGTMDLGSARPPVTGVFAEACLLVNTSLFLQQRLRPRAGLLAKPHQRQTNASLV